MNTYLVDKGDQIVHIHADWIDTYGSTVYFMVGESADEELVAVVTEPFRLISKITVEG